ncbi:MAG: long-chain fatty acid--CoA ligase, partial [Tannerellaceae bacterium]|nr:long-chain fatty acid--CoA ligase [Tannerellaceae bacterium]
IRINEITPDDIATIIYTSGTTGESKGVVLQHSCFLEVFRIHDIRLPLVNDKDVSMCFLPLTHIFEKAWSCYCLHKGVTIAINQDPKMIQKTLLEVQPTLMCNVPRFWEKAYVGVQDKIASSPKFMQKIFRDAIETGRRYNLEYKNENKKPPVGLSLKFNLYNKTVYTLLKRVLGLEKGRLFPTAGAPLAANVDEFLQSVNIPIVVGYGLSETSATVCFYPEKHFIIGSIGTIMPGLEVKIDETNNEILVKGKTVTSGYYNKPEENQKAFTKDGFFRTGDAGRLEGNVLFFTERIKDLYKTSNGKYIAPQVIEGLMTSDKYIQQIAVIGDQRKFVSALIVPDFEQLKLYAGRKHISYSLVEELVCNSDIIRMYESRIEEHQKDLASYEKIKKFVLLYSPFTMESRELTDTLKLRRPVILENYKKEIEEIYKE